MVVLTSFVICGCVYEWLRVYVGVCICGGMYVLVGVWVCVYEWVL